MSKYHSLIKLDTLLLVVLIITAFVSCKASKEQGEKIKDPEILPDDVVEIRADQAMFAGIETGIIEMHSLSGLLKVNGIVSVAPQALATICAPMGGFIKSITLMPGKAVHKGETLAIIENQEFIDIQQNYLEARNKLEFVEADYNRHYELYKDEVYSQKNVQQVTSEYKSLKVQVKALEQKLILIGINPAGLHEDNIARSVVVVSPISGYIKSVNINIGKVVSSNDVLLEIINTDKLLLELTLFEKDVNKVAIGQRIRFFINDETEQHQAVVYQTGKSVNDDKTYKVYATITKSCKNILPGMYVNALIETSGNKVTALPSDAVVSFDDKNYIFVFIKNKKEKGKEVAEYRMIEVRKGMSDGRYTETILPEGFDIQTAKVVIKGAYNLLSAKKNAGEMSC